MTNGKILLALNFSAVGGFFLPTPIFFFEFDPFQNTFTEVRGPGNPGAPSVWSDCGATTMLVLPDGTVLMPSGCDNTQLYVYQPSGPPLAQGKPAISAITPKSGNAFHLTGLGLTGVSEGASFGDDAQMASNYPIVRLTDSGGQVQYARTSNWSTTGVQVSGIESTDFTVPSQALAAGETYSLQVGVNGYWSDYVPFPCQSGESWNGSAGKCEAATIAVCTAADRTSGCRRARPASRPEDMSGVRLLPVIACVVRLRWLALVSARHAHARPRNQRPAARAGIFARSRASAIPRSAIACNARCNPADCRPLARRSRTVVGFILTQRLNWAPGSSAWESCSPWRRPRAALPRGQATPSGAVHQPLRVRSAEVARRRWPSACLWPHR